MSTTTTLPPANTFIKELEAGALSFIAAELTANEATFEADVATIESDAQAALANLLKNIPSVKGVAGLAIGPIESMLESALSAYAASLITKYGPQVLFTATQALIAKLAAEV
jgi:hypothetical protein